jgi:seryl-tRNA synthetase
MDIELIRNDPDRVRRSQRARYASETLVDLVIALDEVWRKGKSSALQRPPAPASALQCEWHMRNTRAQT